MSLLTPTQLKDHGVETDLCAADLQNMIDAAEQDIIERFGEHTSQVDDFDGLTNLIFPTRKIDATKTIGIVETVRGVETTVTSSGYRVENGGWVLRRMTTQGTQQIWGERVRLSYSPTISTARRKMVIVDLVKLQLTYDGTSRTHVGDTDIESGNYDAERERILSRLDLSKRQIA